MSIERELLEKVISGDNKGDFFVSYDLYKEIYEFLAQPEEEAVYQKLLRIEKENYVEMLPSELWLDGYETGKRSALLSKQPEQEPEAWMWTRNYEGGGYTNKVFEFLNDAEEYAKDSKTLKSPDIIRPLYTAPPTREGLTPREGLTEYKKGYAQAELDLKRQPLTNENSDTVSAFNPVSNNYWSR